MSEALIFFATQTGNAETAAEMIRDHLRARGISASITDIARLPMEQFLQQRVIIGTASTWGDGEPPDDALDFWEALAALPDQAMIGQRFAIYALGDSCYDEFCAFGKNLDQALERLGGQRLIERYDCDIDFEDFVEPWASRLADALLSAPLAAC